jgi:hypothetical protein
VTPPYSYSKTWRETMSNGSFHRWSFVHRSDNGATAWVWQRFGPDGRLEKTSEPHATYGKAQMAALQDGFRPDQDEYILELPYGRMHFAPGRRPEYCEPPQAQATKSNALFRRLHNSRRRHA